MSSEKTAKLAAGLSKIGLVLRHHAWKAADEAGLSATQTQVIVLLRARDRGVGLTVSELAEELAITAATVSDSIAALERKELVTRARDERDARIVRVRLTAEGSAKAREAALWPDFLLMAIDTLSEQEQEVFVRGLVKMIYALQQSGQIPTARMCPTCTYFRPGAHAGASKPHHCAYVNAPLGDGDLRLECAEHEGAPRAELPQLWQLFIGGKPLSEKTARSGGEPSQSSGRPKPNQEN